MDATIISTVKGSHLTVTTYSDGKYEMIWDWQALTDEVAMIKSTPELAELGKLEMERLGRNVEIELDRRRKKTRLATELKDQIVKVGGKGTKKAKKK